MNETTPSLSSMSASSASRLQPTHEEIARRAQDLWEKYGRPSGRDQEIWFEAERSLQLASSGPSPAKPAPAVQPAPAAKTTPPPVVSSSKTAPAPRKTARGGRATAR